VQILPQKHTHTALPLSSVLNIRAPNGFFCYICNSPTYRCLGRKSADCIQVQLCPSILICTSTQMCLCVYLYYIVYVNLRLFFSVQISADLRIWQESLCWPCGLFVVREGEQRLMLFSFGPTFWNVHKVLLRTTHDWLTDFEVIFWEVFTERLQCKCYCLLADKHLVLWTSRNISHFDYCCWFEVGIRSKAGKTWATVIKS